jgi:hypothetical protein
MLEDVEFDFLEEIGGVVRAVKYRGVFGLFLITAIWAITMPPYTHKKTGKRFGGWNGLNPCVRVSNVLSGS